MGPEAITTVLRVGGKESEPREQRFKAFSATSRSAWPAVAAGPAGNRYPIATRGRVIVKS